MKTILFPIGCAILVSLNAFFDSCISRPVMHCADNRTTTHASLLDALWDEKIFRVDAYLDNSYMPALLHNELTLLGPDADMRREMQDIIAAIIPKINARRDSILAVIQVEGTRLSAHFSKYRSRRAFNSIGFLREANTAMNDFIIAPCPVAKSKSVLSDKLSFLLKNSLRHSKTAPLPE